MSNLSLPTIDLTTAISAAPLNGPPSSADYNETQREILTDLANLSQFVNTILLPLLQSLTATALNPTTIGIQGSTVVSDSSDTSVAFYDSIAQQSLTIADSIRVIMNLISGLQLDFTDLDLQIGALQSTLANNNQSNLSSTVSGLQATVNNLTALVSNETNEINFLNSLLGSITGNTVSTGSVAALSTVQVQVNLTTAYIDNNYTPILSLEDPSGQLEILSFTYQTGGVGVFVLVKNNDPSNAQMGNIHILTKHL